MCVGGGVYMCAHACVQGWKVVLGGDERGFRAFLGLEIVSHHKTSLYVT